MKVLILPVLLGALVPALGQTAPGTNAAPSAPVPAAAATAAPIDPAKEAEIRKMIQLSGTVQRMKMVMDRSLEMMRERNYTLPKEFWTRLETEMDPNTLVDQLIPLYDQYYSLDDLKAVNAFYASPAGRHMLQVQGAITTQAMQIGQTWGRDAVHRVMGEMEEEKVKAAIQHTNAAPAPDAVPSHPSGPANSQAAVSPGATG